MEPRAVVGSTEGILGNERRHEIRGDSRMEPHHGWVCAPRGGHFLDHRRERTTKLETFHCLQSCRAIKIRSPFVPIRFRTNYFEQFDEIFLTRLIRNNRVNRRNCVDNVPQQALKYSFEWHRYRDRANRFPKVCLKFLNVCTIFFFFLFYRVNRETVWQCSSAVSEVSTCQKTIDR